MKDRTLIDIFTTQAKSALAAMNDDSCSDGKRRREVADLRGAAELLGNADIEIRIEAIVANWESAEMRCLEELSAMIRELRPLRAPIIRGNLSDGKARAASQNDTIEGDSVKTIVQAKPNRRSNKFDTGEHLTLLNFFREEATEGLDQITELLLASTINKPSEIVWRELMRLTHGLKGAAGTVDLPTVADLSHQYEGVVERIRLGLLEWNMELRDELVEVADQLRFVIADAVDPAATRAGAESLKRRLAKLDSKATTEDRATKPELLVTEINTAHTFLERRRPDRRSADSPMLRVDPSRIDRPDE